MRGRWSLLLLVLALAGPALAQDASFTVEQADVPVGLEIEAGSSTSLSFGVNLTGENFSCAADVEAPVNGTLDAQVPSSAPENASVTTTNASKTFPIPAGDYHTQAYNESASAEVSVEAAGGVRENYTATLELVSVFPGGTYQDCVPNELPEAESEAAEIQLDVIADEPPEPEEPATDDTANETNETPTNGTANETEQPEDENGLPVAWQLVPVAVAGAALAARADREG